MSSVRSVALKSIARITGKGDQHIIQLLAPLLRDAEYPVRCSAVMAIAEVANTGDEDAITLLATRLEDPDYPVRCATAMALAQVASKGNKRVIGLVSGLCVDEHRAVENAARKCLVKMEASRPTTACRGAHQMHAVDQWTDERADDWRPQDQWQQSSWHAPGQQWTEWCAWPPWNERHNQEEPEAYWHN